MKPHGICRVLCPPAASSKYFTNPELSYELRPPTVGFESSEPC